ncbi:hypothetical protein ACJJTC_003996 [Scirpophaga incertulas]
MSTMYSCCEGSKEEELKLECVHCGGMFHGSCIDPTSSRNVASIDKKNWICPSCAAKRPKEVKSDNTPIRSSTQKSTPSDNVTLRLKKKKTASESTVKDKSQDAVNVLSATIKPVERAPLKFFSGCCRDITEEAISFTASDNQECGQHYQHHLLSRSLIQTISAANLVNLFH